MTPEQRREAIQRIAGERRQEVAKLRSQGPACLYCVHGPERSAKGLCSHPIFWHVGAEATTDSFTARSMMSTVTARSADGLCGPEAELFQPRFVLARVWRAIRPHLPLFGADFRR